MGHYFYPMSGIPGFRDGNRDLDGQVSDHLADLIRTQIARLADDTPENQLFVIGGLVEAEVKGIAIDTTQFDLTNDEKTLLDACVQHAADKFIITTDGGVTDLGDPGVLTMKVSTNLNPLDPNFGLPTSTVVTLKWKDGDGNDSNGFGNKAVVLDPTGTGPIDKTEGSFDGNGKFAFTVGASTQRGTWDIPITVDKMPVKTARARWK